METRTALITVTLCLVACVLFEATAARGIDTNEHQLHYLAFSNEKVGSLASPHIVGGHEAIPYSYPHQVVLIVRRITAGDADKKEVCGGSLLSESWVITAAHCVDAYVIFQNKEVDTEKNKLVITAGFGVHSLYGLYSSKAQVIKVSEIIIHPEWASFPINNDIALLKLEKNVNLGKYVKTIRLPRPSEPFSGSPVTITGWGTTNANKNLSDKLHAVDSTVLDNFYCKLRYLFLLVRDTNICAYGQGGKNTCHSDRGGPLITKEADGEPTLIGITSFGFGCKWWFPNVFTRITSYLEWINKTTNLPTRT